LYKRLHRAFFRLPEAGENEHAVQIDAAALAQLLAGVKKDEGNRKKLLM
jgi:hypothetical protein